MMSLMANQPICCHLSDIDFWDDFVFSLQSTEIRCTMKHCSNKDCNVEPLHNLPYICNQLTLTIRKHIKEYYEVSVNVCYR